MVSRNDITNDKIQTKGVLSKEGEDNWERIFGKHIKEQKLSSEDLQSLKDVTDVTTEIRNVNATDQDTKVDTSSNVVKLTQDEANSIETIEALIEIHKEKKKSRIDTVGQNGNDGLHYEYELNKSTGEVEKRFEDGTWKPSAKDLTDAFNGH